MHFSICFHIKIYYNMSRHLFSNAFCVFPQQFRTRAKQVEALQTEFVCGGENWPLQRAHERTHRFPKIAIRAKDRTRFILVVRLRSVQVTAFLRRFAQRNGPIARQIGRRRTGNSCLVRV
jgi:hypothetical protein